MVKGEDRMAWVERTGGRVHKVAAAGEAASEWKGEGGRMSFNPGTGTDGELGEGAGRTMPSDRGADEEER